jgi:hypothetical protein
LKINKLQFSKQREEIILIKYKFKEEKSNLILKSNRYYRTICFFLIQSQHFPNSKLKKIFYAKKFVKIINLL